MSKQRLNELYEANEAKGEHFRAVRDKYLDRTAPEVITAFNLFQTPPEIAEKMAVSIPFSLEGTTILDPSVGLGRLVDALPVETHSNLTVCDISAK